MLFDPVFERDESIFGGCDDFQFLNGGKGAVDKVFEGLPHLSGFSAIADEKREAF